MGPHEATQTFPATSRVEDRVEGPRPKELTHYDNSSLEREVSQPLVEFPTSVAPALPRSDFQLLLQFSGNLHQTLNTTSCMSLDKQVI